MSKPVIVCVDDQRDVLTALLRDLDEFREGFELLACESAEEALEELDEFEADDRLVALFVCDHIMPQMTGVEFLSSLVDENRFEKARKILLTGLASHEDTIVAINKGSIDYYIPKPWKREALITIVKQQLTHSLLDQGQEHAPFIQWLDQPTLYTILRKTV